MEKTWYQKLMSAYTEHTDAEFEEKGDNKIAKALQDWEKISHDALHRGWMLEFEEILSWRDCIAPKFQDSYADVLKSKALTSPDRLLVVILTGKTDEVIAISEKFDTSLLSKTTEKVILECMGDDKVRVNVLAVINNRPDILNLFNSETFRSFSINDDNAPFLKNEKLYLLLNCFTESKEYKAFSDKIKPDQRFTWAFNNNQEILKKWSALSSFELTGASNFNKVITIHWHASKDWQNDINNFKIILSLLESKYFSTFLSHVKNFYGEKSFYTNATIIAQQLKVERELNHGEQDFRKLYYEAPDVKLEISKTKRKIIKAYLKS